MNGKLGETLGIAGLANPREGTCISARRSVIPAAAGTLRCARILDRGLRRDDESVATRVGKFPGAVLDRRRDDCPEKPVWRLFFSRHCSSTGTATQRYFATIFGYVA
jgi:hypothetical protein